MSMSVLTLSSSSIRHEKTLNYPFWHTDLLKEYNVELKGPFNYSARDIAGIPRDWYVNYIHFMALLPLTNQELGQTLNVMWLVKSNLSSLLLSWQPNRARLNVLCFFHLLSRYDASSANKEDKNEHLSAVCDHKFSSQDINFFPFCSGNGSCNVQTVLQVYDRLASIISMESENSSLNRPSEWIFCSKSAILCSKIALWTFMVQFCHEGEFKAIVSPNLDCSSSNLTSSALSLL